MRPVLAATILMFSLAAHAATPPTILNYQGVLRDAADEARDGDFDMVFRLFDAESGGNELLVDSHLDLNAQSVRVRGGLFDTSIGGGSVTDGSGPGTYASLADVFRDQASVWLEIEVGRPNEPREKLAPRVRVAASAYAQNASTLDGRPTGDFLQTGSALQTRTGPLQIRTALSSGWAFSVDTGTPSVGAAWFLSGNDGDARLAAASWGIFAQGQAGGAWFENYGLSRGYLAVGNTGVKGWGRWGGCETCGEGGLFETPGYSGIARLSVGDAGVLASGSFAGGIFRETDSGAQAYLAYNNTGVYGFATNSIETAAYFEDRAWTPWTWTEVGESGAKVRGNGGVYFVQNHPEDPAAEIAYAAPEGDEVAVYTRGSARLTRGEARVRLGETFRLVANPDVGVTAHLTPRGTWADLYVASVTTEELVVRSRDGSSDAGFDYAVWGLRLGFEDRPVVRPKRRDAPIPSTVPDDAILAARPELRSTTPSARFERMRRDVDPASRPVDRSRGAAMVAAINAASSRTGAAASPPPAPTAADSLAPVVYPPGSLPVPVSERVEAGDLLVADPLRDGSFARSSLPSDPGVAGIVAGSPGSSWTSEAPLAFAGTVVVAKADATQTRISRNDLLVASPLPGHVMRSPDGAAAGTIVGKALESLDSGTGSIRVLVMSR